MRKCILYMVGLMLSVATIGCVKTDDPTAVQTGVLRLQLSNGEHSTRADGDAEDTDPLNEFKLATAQVFFLDASDNVLESHYVADLNAVQEETVTIPLSAEQLTALFDDNGKGHVYVIANYGSEITDATTLAALKAKAIGFEETKETTEDGVEITHVATQSSFVMDSEPIEVTYDGQDKTISGEVPLTRAAAKIELTVNVAPLTQDGKTWTANTGAMTVTLHNGVKDGIVDDDSDGAPKAAQAGATLFNDSRQFSGVVDANGNPITVEIDGVTYTQHVQTIPFYSYSTKWNAGDDDEVYLEVAIPWKVSNGSDESYQTFYYQVPVSIEKLALVRNNFYQLTLTVGVLGGLTERVTVEPSYTVIDWGSQEVNVNLSRPKYLVVDENRVVLNNLQSIGVGYQSSDAVTVTVLSSTIGGTNGNYAVYSDYSVAASGGEIVFNHRLDNTRSDTDKTYDYLPQTVVVRVAHTTDSDIYEDITFVQYPAMYVEYETMSKSTVFINGNSSGGNGNWWYVRNGSSASKNMYTITVSAFDQSTAEYIIADPREPANNTNFVFRENINANSNEYPTATDASVDSTLTGYRAAVSGTSSEYLIAPKLLVSSSYISNGPGTSGASSYSYETNGKYRCAGYQENGYPAGRWRLPTPAEILYIGRLCAEGKVDEIFVNTATYLSSNGAYRYSSDNGGSVTRTGDSSATLRCVYDIWYWKDKCANVSQFIWGADGDNLEKKRADGYLVTIK